MVVLCSSCRAPHRVLVHPRHLINGIYESRIHLVPAQETTHLQLKLGYVAHLKYPEFELERSGSRTLLQRHPQDCAESAIVDRRAAHIFTAATMARVLFFLALLVAAASAFVSPAQHAGELLNRGIQNLSGIVRTAILWLGNACEHRVPAVVCSLQIHCLQ